MKTFALLATVALSLCAASAAEAQSDTTTTTHTKRTTRQVVTARNNASLNQRLRRIEANSRTVTTATPQGTRIDGSVTRVVRSRNPLQMVNPFAPKEYGDGSDVTRREPEDPFQRPEGLRLFAVEF